MCPGWLAKGLQMDDQSADSTSSTGNPGDIVGYREDVARYRRRPGGWWIAALVGVPLVLALIGGAIAPADAPTAVATTSGAVVPTMSAPATAVSSAAVVGTPFALVRSGSTVTISGSFPDEASRLAAVQAFKTAVGTGLVVVDKTTVVAGSAAMTPAQATGLGAATAGVTDFSMAVSGNALTVTGTAISEAAKAAAEKAVKDAFPALTLTSSITVVAPTGCDALISQVATYLGGHKLEFGPASPALTDASKAAVTQVATLLKPCPAAKVAVNGYTDNQGSDSTSLPLSQARATSVRDMLVAAGVTNPITATGFGSANPVGDNSTDAGRAANRRVEIVIS